MNWSSFGPFNALPGGIVPGVFAGVFGSLFFLPLIVALIALKGVALWRAARNGHQWWFIAILVINLVGILEIVYLLTVGKEKKSPANSSPHPTPPTA